MARYFLELCYKGTAFSGFQRQDNAVTVQEEVEKALKIYFRDSFELTGSSRTDAGVHALSNFFHFDSDINENEFSRSVYHLNAILPPDVVIKRIFRVNDDSHCRFDAISRSYEYYIHTAKDPFINDRSYFFPFKTDFSLLNEYASEIPYHNDFETFSKRNTQVHTYNCVISESVWKREGDRMIYRVTGTRFLRGMVRGLAGTMLRCGRQGCSVDEFRAIILSKDVTRADFSVPGKGLFLVEVRY